MKELVKKLVSEFGDKEYAHAYMEEFSNMAIAAQIKALREQRNWTQQQLAQASQMKQERVSALEDVDYDAWTIKTLRKLARAFDLTLKVSFEKFSSSITEMPKIDRQSLQRPSREQDLMEFSRNEYGHGETTWASPVKTGQANVRVVPLRKVA
ncbi:MAG: helix-turn-helix transcriptional regulator [Methylococcales bacterium]